jgi:Zn-dependent M28 family amino/carboxypeptidase
MTVTRDQVVASHLASISEDRIKGRVKNLSDFHNRHSKSQNIGNVAEWLKDELIRIGYDNGDISFHSYSERGFNLKNVVCDKKGTTDKIILLCAHYDTILNSNRNDTESRQPGANDNASGVASLLEIAHVVANLNLKHSIRFVFFSGEEQGFWGSTHYSQHLKDNNVDLHVVLNMDMCAEPGFLPTLTTANVDIDDGETGVDPDEAQSEASTNFGLSMKAFAEAYTDLSIEFDPIDASDYMPFEARGYVCIGAYDGAAKPNNTHYHSVTDVMENLDFKFLTSITKMELAFVIKEAIDLSQTTS